MTRTTRREFVRRSTLASLAFGMPGLMLDRSLRAADAGPNAEVRVAILGMGGIKTVGGVGGRGRQLLERFRGVPGARVVALCDLDQAILDHEVQLCNDKGHNVAAFGDLRRAFDDHSIDAVAVATPNHWHALATIWACQAGKDVYCEKPFSYNIFEGRQAVAAARRHDRMVQTGSQRRSCGVIREALDYLHGGGLGPIRSAHALIFRAREGIGRANGPTPVPATVNYDLWCGPAGKDLVPRKQFHYDWHWYWLTGNGEIGNNGAHSVDIARLALRQEHAPPRTMSIGGRFGFDDDGQTANTQVVLYDYPAAPLVCEIRSYRSKQPGGGLGNVLGTDHGVAIACEGGTLLIDAVGGKALDKQGKVIKAFTTKQKPAELETAHVANFIAAVRSRKRESLNAEARIGHVTATCLHLGNLSHRLGKCLPPEAIVAAAKSSPALADAFQRCQAYLEQQGLDLAKDQATAGPWLQFDPQQECCVGEFAEPANTLSQRNYRAPFVVPKLV